VWIWRANRYHRTLREPRLHKIANLKAEGIHLHHAAVGQPQLIKVLPRNQSQIPKHQHAPSLLLPLRDQVPSPLPPHIIFPLSKPSCQPKSPETPSFPITIPIPITISISVYRPLPSISNHPRRSNPRRTHPNHRGCTHISHKPNIPKHRRHRHHIRNRDPRRARRPAEVFPAVGGHVCHHPYDISTISTLLYVRSHSVTSANPFVLGWPRWDHCGDVGMWEEKMEGDGGKEMRRAGGAYCCI